MVLYINSVIFTCIVLNIFQVHIFSCFERDTKEYEQHYI
jgi:hypothetical protein